MQVSAARGCEMNFRVRRSYRCEVERRSRGSCQTGSSEKATVVSSNDLHKKTGGTRENEALPDACVGKTRLSIPPAAVSCPRYSTKGV